MSAAFTLSREEMIALVDRSLSLYGLPAYSSLHATLSTPAPDDGADPQTIGLAIAEIRRQRVAHRDIVEDLALARMALGRGDIANAAIFVDEALRRADRHARRLQANQLPSEVTVLAFERAARAEREVGHVG